ncbi:MAG: nuclear transport factor 2 family protein, partial [Flavobacterium sp.]
EQSPKEVVSNFFIAFHAKDTVALKSYCHQEIILQTIQTKNEINQLKKDNLSTFLKNIATIPNHITFKEKILDFKVEKDDILAHVWTPYQFYINEKLNHYGINSFTLININGLWKIIHLIDTRKKYY